MEVKIHVFKKKRNMIQTTESIELHGLVSKTEGSIEDNSVKKRF